MIPLECASIRSIARWVLPVLVGPSTAVTPAPRARASLAWVEKEIVIKFLGAAAGMIPALRRCRKSRCRISGGRHQTRINPPNEPRTNRGRIADLPLVRLRSRQQLARCAMRATRWGELRLREP